MTWKGLVPAAGTDFMSQSDLLRVVCALPRPPGKSLVVNGMPVIAVCVSIARDCYWSETSWCVFGLAFLSKESCIIVGIQSSRLVERKPCKEIHFIGRPIWLCNKQVTQDADAYRQESDVTNLWFCKRCMRPGRKGQHRHGMCKVH